MLAQFLPRHFGETLEGGRHPLIPKRDPQFANEAVEGCHDSRLNVGAQRDKGFVQIARRFGFLLLVAVS